MRLLGKMGICFRAVIVPICDYLFLLNHAVIIKHNTPNTICLQLYAMRWIVLHWLYSDFLLFIMAPRRKSNTSDVLDSDVTIVLA